MTGAGKSNPTARSDAEAEAVIDAFDSGSDYVVTDTDVLTDLRAAAASLHSAEHRIEAAALRAHRAEASGGVIGAQLGMTRQDARQRFERLTRI
jgi:hypothetical protein